MAAIKVLREHYRRKIKIKHETKGGEKKSNENYSVKGKRILRGSEG